MRNLKLTLAYDGTRFHGWQVQPEVPTIQGELERVLGNILGQTVRVVGSGRTDAGVHAHGQVAHLHVETSMDTDTLLRAANALLPTDIRVLYVEEVSPEFHARFSAWAKTYEYWIWRPPIASPFHYRYVYPFRYPLDAEAVDRATGQFVGDHDFTSFCATSTEVEDHRRSVYEASWDRDDKQWIFRIRANGFLQYMVRTIVGTLLEVGQGKIGPDQIPEIFNARDRRCAGPSVPACGLHLIGVEY